MADQHGAHQTSEACVVSLCEDYCKSPSALAGYMISQKLAMSTLVCGSVNGCGTPVLNMSSRITNVTGNEAGIGGGVNSNVCCGMCKPVGDYATTVRAENQCLLRHDTVMEMNTAGRDGPHNTVGKINYCGSGKYQGGRWIDKKRTGTYTTKNGMEIPFYEAGWDPGPHGSPSPGGEYIPDPKSNTAEIVILKTSDRIVSSQRAKHEIIHAEQDALDGKLNNEFHELDEDGNLRKLNRAQREAVAYRDQGIFFNRKGTQMASKLHEAGDLIAKGDIESIEEAQQIADKNPGVANDIELTICEEHGIKRAP